MILDCLGCGSCAKYVQHQEKRDYEITCNTKAEIANWDCAVDKEVAPKSKSCKQRYCKEGD